MNPGALAMVIDPGSPPGETSSTFAVAGAPAPVERGGREEAQTADEAVDVTLRMNDPASLLDALHEAIHRFLDQLRMPPADEWQILFELAVSEIAANIIEHVRPRTIRFRVAAQPRGVVAEFTDSGRGWLRQLRPAARVERGAERGRGLSLAWTAVDELAYERTGKTNRWRLMKTL